MTDISRLTCRITVDSGEFQAQLERMRSVILSLSPQMHALLIGRTETLRAMTAGHSDRLDALAWATSIIPPRNQDLDGSACVEEWDPEFDPRSILIKAL